MLETHETEHKTANSASSCPDPEDLLGLLENPRSMDCGTLLHLTHCRACGEALGFVAGSRQALEAPSAASAPRAYTADAWAELARVLKMQSEGALDAFAASSENRFLSFAGDGGALGWRARVELAGLEAGDDSFAVSVTLGDAPARGIFRFFGEDVSVRDGAGTLPRSAFGRLDIRSDAVAFVPEGGAAISGHPVFPDWEDRR